MREKRRVNVIEMRCLRRRSGVTVREWIRNEEIMRKVRVLNDLSGRVKMCVLRWFGDVERIDDKRTGKMVYDSGMEGR